MLRIILRIRCRNEENKNEKRRNDQKIKEMSEKGSAPGTSHPDRDI